MYKPVFEITPELLRLITQAAELRAWITSSVVDVAWLPALQRETAARLAHSSTAIEGNPLTLPEVEALSRGEEISAREKDKQEVLNYFAAMRWLWGRKSGDTVTERDVLHLHKLLTQKILPVGQSVHYKTRPNRVVNARGVTVYTPPPPAQVPLLTRELLSWLNSPESHGYHPILVSAVAHHRMVSIHPFADGNGRLARSLGVQLLYTRGFDTHHLFALDEYFEHDRMKYYEKIQQARELDDILTYWLEYAARGVVETLHRTKERILSLKITAKAPRMTLTKRQEDFLRFLRDRGRVKAPEIEKAFKLTRARVNQILLPLVKAGLVTREGHTRATTYHLP